MKPLVTCLTRELYMYLAQDLLIVTHVQKTKPVIVFFSYPFGASTKVLTRNSRQTPGWLCAYELDK